MSTSPARTATLREDLHEYSKLIGNVTHLLKCRQETAKAPRSSSDGLRDMMDAQILPGTAHIGDDAVDVALALRGSTVSLHAGAILVGSWPVDQCRIEQDQPGIVTFVADGEVLEIRVDDGSGRRTRARRLGNTQLWVSASEASWEQARRSVNTAEQTRSRSPKAPAALAAVAAVVLVGGWSAMQSSSRAQQPTPTTVVATTSIPPGTEETPAPVPTAAEFVTAWNAFAAETGSEMLLPVAGPTRLTRAGLEVSIIAGADGILELARLRGQPGLDAATDRRLLEAIGQLLAAADPNSSGSARRALLARLGFDVNDPSLHGLDGRVVDDGLEYRIAYDAGGAGLELTVSPLG